MQYRVKSISTDRPGVHYINNNQEHYVEVRHHHVYGPYCEIVHNGFVKMQKYCTPETIPDTVIELIKTGL